MSGRSCPPAYAPLRPRTLLWQLVVVVLAEVLLYTAYAAHEARFHWATHFLVGLTVAALWRALFLLLAARPTRFQLLSILGFHMWAMWPDLVFRAPGTPHYAWMDWLALGHVSSHTCPAATAAGWSSPWSPRAATPCCCAGGSPPGTARRRQGSPRRSASAVPARSVLSSTRASTCWPTRRSDRRCATRTRSWSSCTAWAPPPRPGHPPPRRLGEQDAPAGGLNAFTPPHATGGDTHADDVA